MKQTVVLYYPKICYEKNYKFSWSPLSLLAISKLLNRNEFKIIIIDGNSNKNYENLIKDNIEDCICVGISIMTGGGQIEDGLLFVERFIKSNIPVVFGGPHPTSLPEETIKNNLVDIVVRGQGEFTFNELVNSLARNLSLENILGISYKRNGNVIHNSERRIISDLNALPDMPWELINIENYIRNDETINTRTFNLLSSYGCPFNCKFCYEVAAYQRKWACLNAERILKEISMLVLRYQINGIKFYDANFFIDTRRVIEFARGLIEKNLSIKWAASAHNKNLLKFDDKDFGIIRDSGCTRILIGAESGSEMILKYIDKRTLPQETLEVAKRCDKFNIIASFTFITGFPNEIDSEIAKTETLIKEIRNRFPQHEIRIHIWAPFPGTSLYNEAIKNGFIPPTSLEKWSNYNYYEPQTPWLTQKSKDMVYQYTYQHNLRTRQ